MGPERSPRGVMWRHMGAALLAGLAACAHVPDEARDYCARLNEGYPIPAQLASTRLVHVGSEVVVFNKERKGCSCRFTLRDDRVQNKRLTCPSVPN